MRIVTPESMQTRRGPEEWFTGTVWMDASPAGPSPDASVFRVFFEPGGEPPADVEAGGVVLFAPDERHWHGAGPDSYMVHAAVSPAAHSGGGTDWLEPVTDEQYAGV